MELNFNITENPSYLQVYEFEKYDHEGVRLWLKKNWSFIVYTSVVYVSLIKIGQKWMAERKPYELKKQLVVWNGFLTILSFAVFIRMLPELIVECAREGFYSSLCHFENHNVATSFWGVLFCFSKVLDFGDTLFLVLAKKPVIFLHWYHHVTVAVYCLYVADSSDPSSRWFAVMNSFVHTIMYAYYGLKAMNLKISRKISMLITSVQISQMIFGMYINFLTYFTKVKGVACDRPYWNIEVALMMYASYFMLFAHFFYRVYVSRSQQQKLKRI
ncbi:unnamed protein product [Orchesella dallaii]|uniref:Elongation of very long chain fatty acids protein n=1 Tax=Orchesella dallaii TaxID=48710 RepID=A0ABP1QWL9_9HEXA